MRVSILSLNLVGRDAVGVCILEQMRFFRRRGDNVRIYTVHRPDGVPADIENLTTVTTQNNLINGGEDHFRLSDLYIYHYPSRHALMDSIKVIERGAVVFYYHNVTPPELWSSPVSREELVTGVEGVSLVHYADLAVAASPFSRDDLVQCGYDPERIHLLPYAVSQDRFSPGPKDPALVRRYGLEAKRVLLFVGRMASNKRIDLLIEALPRVRARVPNVVLMMVGDADSSEPYRQVSEQARRRASDLGVGDAVIFTGVVDVPPYYRLADVYVTASLHEGFGVPLIEAMASGVPVVASRAAAHPWVVGDAGILCEPEDPVSVADSVIRLLRDDQAYGDLVQRGLRRARSFSTEAYEAGLAEVVDEAMRWVHALPPLRSQDQPDPSYAEVGSSFAVGRQCMRADDLIELFSQSDVMLRSYEVRSRLPLVGSLIAWVRRNLTSHLREPYLDPTLERQVAFNRRLVDALERTRLRALEQSQTRRQEVTSLEEQLVRLEKRMKLLEAQMRLVLARQREGVEADMAELEEEIAVLTAELKEL